jgi:hypothetical protein
MHSGLRITNYLMILKFSIAAKISWEIPKPNYPGPVPDIRNKLAGPSITSNLFSFSGIKKYIAAKFGMVFFDA